MIVETVPGTKLLDIPEDGRLRMDAFRQLQEEHVGIAGRVADGLNLTIADFYRAIHRRAVRARYEGPPNAGKLVLEVDL